MRPKALKKYCPIGIAKTSIFWTHFFAKIALQIAPSWPPCRSCIPCGAEILGLLVFDRITRQATRVSGLVCNHNASFFRPGSDAHPTPMAEAGQINASFNYLGGYCAHSHHCAASELILAVSLVFVICYKPIGPTARKSVQGRLLYHL